MERDCRYSRTRVAGFLPPSKPWELGMRLCVTGVVVLAVSAGLLGDPPPEKSTSERVAQLVKQLGHDRFVMREAASKELDEIGEPALDAIRKAATVGDAEVRQRAELLITKITAQVRAAVTKKELEKLQGKWSLISYEMDGRQIKGEDARHLFDFKGDRWSLEVNGQLFQGGTVAQIEANAKHNAIELKITEGSNVNATATSIYSVVGETLKYLNCGVPRAVDFSTKAGDGRHFLTFRRVKPVDK